MTFKMQMRVFFVGFGALIVYAVLCEAYMATGRTACLNAGYPEMRVPGFVPFVSQRYCVKRVNQTDIVVRLDSLERAK